MPDFAPVFAELAELMKRNAPGMVVKKDGPDGLLLLAPWAHPRKPDEAMWFGSVRPGKAYVSYHLMPLYMNDTMLAKVPPELKKRMQGKTCFNFKAADPALFSELETLTRACAEAYAKPLVL
ncbi:hypothetical protein [Phenylobacterium sp.]|jgi:hypothetical protein|uniref:hypothetical protein n=1 Tax=Phenylobacterium sp. TaxID=1871053 RepID=UPI002F9456EA